MISWWLLACAHKAPNASSPAPLPTWAGQVCSSPLPEVVATIDGAPITAAELTASDPQGLIEAESALSQARSDALEGLIVDRLIAARAKADGQDPDAWVEARIAERTQPVTDDEIETFYRDNFDRMGGATLSQARDRIREFLEQDHQKEAAAAIIADLTSQGPVIERFLSPFRVLVDDGDGPRLGPPDAKVEIVEFSDFQCPYCAQAAATVHQLAEQYGDKISIVYRHFPLEFHPGARPAAEAASCASEQDAFWRFHDALFADQKGWTHEDLTGYAEKLDLDVNRFEACLSSGRGAARVEADLAAGYAAGMSGTPGFFVNGIALHGAQPLDAFARVIDSELARP